MTTEKKNTAEQTLTEWASTVDASAHQATKGGPVNSLVGRTLNVKSGVYYEPAAQMHGVLTASNERVQRERLYKWAVAHLNDDALDKRARYAWTVLNNAHGVLKAMIKGVHGVQKTRGEEPSTSIQNLIAAPKSSSARKASERPTIDVQF